MRTAFALSIFAIVFIALTVGSYVGKSATADEPLNLTAGYAMPAASTDSQTSAAVGEAPYNALGKAGEDILGRPVDCNLGQSGGR